MTNKYQQNQLKLLTGIPRSGTTLCCRLLNSVNNVIALHEPIDPQQLSNNETIDVVSEITTSLFDLLSRIEKGLPIPHGNAENLILDNPIAESTTANHSQVRELKAVRGYLSLEKPNSDFMLVVKQNAMFTALARQLTTSFPLIAIVRNPVPVLASWMTVDLPVNRGRIPAGEKFDPKLGKLIEQEPSIISRQLLIYNWFCKKFVDAGIPILRYEDIINSGGKALYEKFNITDSPSIALSTPKRTLPEAIIQCLENVAANWEASDSSGLYSATEVNEALTDVRQYSNDAD